jgi:cell division cycle protein 20 (cofactor of APC complex)
LQVAVALNQAVYLWNASSGDIQELLSAQGEDYITSLSWAADGKHLAVGYSNALTQIWDAERCKPVRNLDGHAARVSSLSWNNHTLSTGGRDSIILNHDVRVREHVTATLRGHEQEVCGLKWSPNGTQVSAGEEGQRWGPDPAAIPL